MCLSAKSSCLGSILSICLEHKAADVFKPRTVVRDAPLLPILLWSFQTTRLLLLKCLHGALGFTDLARKIPQDLAQLCIFKSLPDDTCRCRNWWGLFPSHTRSSCSVCYPYGHWCSSLCQLQFQTAHFIQPQSCPSAGQSEARSAVTCWRAPFKTAAKLSWRALRHPRQ